MSATKVAADIPALSRAINTLVDRSGQIGEQADSIVSASCTGGLPSYATQAGQAAEELISIASAMAALANLLSVRRSLAVAAMSSPGLSARLQMAEMRDPDAFWASLQDVAIGMARDAALTSTAMQGTSHTLAALSRLFAGDGILLQPSKHEISQIRLALSKGADAYWKQMKHSPWWGRTMLMALDLKAGTSAAAARAAALMRGGADVVERLERAGRGAGGVIMAGLLASGFQALTDWQDGIRDHRIERVAVSGGVGVASTLIGLGICAVAGLETAGLACFGVVAVAGAAGGVASGEINDAYFTSHRDEIAQMSPDEVAYLRAILDARRAEQWLIKYGKPSERDLEDQLRWATVEHQRYPRSNRGVIRYFRPDGSLLCEQHTRGADVTSTTWFDTKGRELNVG